MAAALVLGPETGVALVRLAVMQVEAGLFLIRLLEAVAVLVVRVVIAQTVRLEAVMVVLALTLLFPAH